MSETTRAPSNSDQPRFVVLRHEMPAGGERPTHWDFMLETPAGLRTWAIEAEPADGQPVSAQALAIHRAEYLTIEGPISGGRGRVERWDAGSFGWQRDEAGHVVVQVLGNRLRGRVELAREAKAETGTEAVSESGGNQRWRFLFTADPV
jgi:DNA polymerase Ligase (LigD)